MLNFGNGVHTIGILIVDRGHNNLRAACRLLCKRSENMQETGKMSGWGNLEHRLSLAFVL